MYPCPRRKRRLGNVDVVTISEKSHGKNGGEPSGGHGRDFGHFEEEFHRSAHCGLPSYYLIRGVLVVSAPLGEMLAVVVNEIVVMLSEHVDGPFEDHLRVEFGVLSIVEIVDTAQISAHVVQSIQSDLCTLQIARNCNKCGRDRLLYSSLFNDEHVSDHWLVLVLPHAHAPVLVEALLQLAELHETFELEQISVLNNLRHVFGIHKLGLLACVSSGVSLWLNNLRASGSGEVRQSHSW
ncbi:hypothetical protein PFISCL1PPCAC_6966, partial [Pristionchus fissidentatus]